MLQVKDLKQQVAASEHEKHKHKRNADASELNFEEMKRKLEKAQEELSKNREIINELSHSNDNQRHEIKEF